MDIDTLRAYKWVVDLRSFTKAAERLFVSQSAVSQKIRKLEKTLGKPLFKPGESHIPTRHGELVYDYSKRIISEYDGMLTRITDTHLYGEVRFGLPEDFASFFLKDILEEFRKSYPNMYLNVECNLTLNLFDKFQNGGYDLVLLKMPAPEDFPNGVEVLREELVWVGDPSLVKLQSSIPLVLAPKPCVYRSRATTSLTSRQIDWEIKFSSASLSSLIAAVNAKMGVTVLPKIMVPKSCTIIRHSYLPHLDDTHISLLKKRSGPAIDSFESFIIRKLRETF